MTDASSNKPMNEIAAAAATLQFYLFIYLFWLGVRGGDIGGSRDDGRLGCGRRRGREEWTVERIGEKAGAIPRRNKERN